MDVKKKLIGNFSRGRELYTQERVYVMDVQCFCEYHGLALLDSYNSFDILMVHKKPPFLYEKFFW